MKSYIGELVDLTGDRYLNPTPAVYDNGTHPRNVNQITSISVHHDASFRPHDYDSAARYRNEAAQHYLRLGPGLQYHYKIDNTGVIFQTRPLDEWLYCVGSAENVTTIAICLDGNFQDNVPGVPTQDPTREQFEALYQLLEVLCEQRPEFTATWPDVRPHSDFSSTACCGNHLTNIIIPITSKETAADHLLNRGTYDWPELQPNQPAPPPPNLPQPEPTPPPVPPTVAINYRVNLNGKQIGAYGVDKNAWQKHRDNPGSVILDQNKNDVTHQLEAKFDTPTPTPAPAEQAHDYGKENNDLLKTILTIVQTILDKIKGVFK